MNKKKIILLDNFNLFFCFYVNKHSNILKVLEENNIKIESQCRSGFCASCRVLLKQGKIKYSNSIIDLCNSNEILSCSCYPITNITINISYLDKK